LLHDSENWITKASDARRITEAEKKYMIRTARYTWTDHKTETAKLLNITPVLVKIQDYKINWIKYAHRMPRNSLLILIKIHPKSQKEPRKTIEETSGCLLQ
jgi:hypothetical protein